MFSHRAPITGKERAHDQGIYICTECGETLFEANKKFSVGSGFPSFWDQIGDHVVQKHLTTYNNSRIQLCCNKCGQHLGHLFSDNRTPTKVRYCINAGSIRLESDMY
jgi:peptide-methionine (R)-S-oxide reductase